jgi:hypothetical protein
MAQLVEGMTRSRSEYGSTYHHYKGVKIRKSSRGYEAELEHFVWETNKFSIREKYLAYQLKNVPSRIEELLSKGDYFVCQNGFLRMTTECKEKFIQSEINRTKADIDDLHNKVYSLLCSRSYKAVEQGAKSLNALTLKLLELNQTLESLKA